MKKTMAVLAALLLVLCCAGALADDNIIEGSMLGNTPASGDGWTWDGLGTLMITKSGMTIQNWGSPNEFVEAEIHYWTKHIDVADLTINNVYLDKNATPLGVWGSYAQVNLMINDSVLKNAGPDGTVAHISSDVRNSAAYLIGENALFEREGPDRHGIMATGNVSKLFLAGNLEIKTDEYAVYLSNNISWDKNTIQMWLDTENYNVEQVGYHKTAVDDTLIEITDYSGNLYPALRKKSCLTIKSTEKLMPVVTVVAEDKLAYNGKEQPLIISGSTTGGTLLYSLDGENWSTEIPTAVEKGSYTVSYKVAADDDYRSVRKQSVVVAIGKGSMPAPVGLTAFANQHLYDVALPKGWTWAEPNDSVGLAGERGHLAHYAGNEDYDLEKNVMVFITVSNVQFNLDVQIVGNAVNGIYTEPPTLIAPEDAVISLDGEKWANSVRLPAEDGVHTCNYSLKTSDGQIVHQSVTVTVDLLPPVLKDLQITAGTTQAQILAVAEDDTSGVKTYALVQNDNAEKLTITQAASGYFTVSGMTPGKSYAFKLTVYDAVGRATQVVFSVTAAELPAAEPPKTGDNSSLVLWMAMLAVSGAGMMMLMRKRGIR